PSVQQPRHDGDDDERGRSCVERQRGADCGASRSHPAGGLPPDREGGALRARAHPGARGARARGLRQGLLRVHPRRDVADVRRLPARARRADARDRALLDGDPRAGVPGDDPRPARVRREVLHPRGQLGPAGQQLPRLLHPRRHQVPRRDPRVQAQPAVARAGVLAGVRLPVAPPREPAHLLLPLRRRGRAVRLPPHGRVRREHVHVRERGGEGAVRQVPLEADVRRAVHPDGRGGGAGRGTEPQPRDAGPVRLHRGGELPGVDAVRAGDGAGHGGAVRLRPAGRHQDVAGGPAAAPPRGEAGAGQERGQLLQRERAAGVRPGAGGARDLLLGRQDAAVPGVRLRRHAALQAGSQLPDAARQRAALRAPQQPLRRRHELHAPGRGGGLLPVQARAAAAGGAAHATAAQAGRGEEGEGNHTQAQRLQAARGEVPLLGRRPTGPIREAIRRLARTPKGQPGAQVHLDRPPRQ
ncbi:hypothetical protein ACJX0J_022918, partial [Zea mays]